MSKLGETADLLKPPFDSDDIFGYLVPGIGLLVCIYVFELPGFDFANRIVSRSMA